MVDDREARDRVFALARTVAPDAIDGVSYGVPSLLVDGKALIGVSARSAGLSLVPFSPAVIDAVRAELGDLAASKGVIRFTAAEPIPDDVVLRLARLRLAEIRPA